MRTTIGDLLLSFGKHDTPVASERTASSWRPLATHAGWSLRTCGTTSTWFGYPFDELQAPSWRAFLLGELYPLRSATLSSSLVDDCVYRGSSDALNGHFALLIWLEEEHQWRIWTSPFGTLHLYLAVGSLGIRLGTAYRDAAACSSLDDLNPEAVRAFLRYGFFLGGDTHLRNVQLLQPGMRYVLSEHGELVGQDRYWRWDSIEKQTASPGDCVERFDALLRSAVTDLTSDQPVALPISGGLDSRSTVAALGKPGEPTEASVEAFSYGYEDRSVETSIAAQVAEARAIDLRTSTIGPYLFDCLPSISASLEGFVDVTLPRQAAIAHQLHCQRVLAAHWGDVWLDASIDPEVTSTDLQMVDGKFRKRGSDWLLAHFQGGPADATPRDQLRAQWEPYNLIDDQDLRFKAFKTDQWSFRWTLASLRTYQTWAFPRLPFYDSRLARFLLSLPAERLRGRRLQIEHLIRYAPDLARIKWQAFDANLYNYRGFNTWLLPKRALKKSHRMITGRQPIQRNWEVQFGGSSGRQHLERYLLSEAGALHEWFRPPAIGELIDDFYRRWPDPGLGYAVSMLVSLASWLDDRPD